MAAHVVGGEAAAGVMSYFPRALVARGVRLGNNAVIDRGRDALLRRLQRKGFDWALEQLDAPPPRLLSRGSPGLVTFFETWVHHEDVRRANDRGPDERADGQLEACLRFVHRYQRRPLSGAVVSVEVPGRERIVLGAGEPAIVLAGPMSEALLWLAGRGAVAHLDVRGDVATLEPTLRI